MKKLLTLLLTGVFSIPAAWAASCPKPSLDASFNLTLPCVGVQGKQYSATFDYAPDAAGVPAWHFGNMAAAACDWDAKTCATADENLQITVPGLSFNDADITVTLDFNAATPAWHYHEHAPSQIRRGKIDSPGSLAPYQVNKVSDGKGRKLLMIYMVGSNLESGAAQAGTTDLLELTGGYRQLANPSVDVLVAFGGSKKDNWRGMKFADMPQLLEDANDARFGNLPEYLYRSDYAHMGDASSFKLFLNYAREAYVNYDSRFLAMWDHGASYMGFGNDEFYNMEPLSLPEIEASLGGSGLHFNLLGFDACLMASLETAKYTHPYADYLLASEELEPGHGWNWTEVLKAYAQNSDIVTAGKAMIDNYIEHTSHPYQSSGKTLSLAKLSHFPAVDAALVAAIEPVLSALNTDVAAGSRQYSDPIQESLQAARGYSSSYNISLDLKDFLTNLEALSADPAFKAKIAPLLEALGNYLVYAKHDGTRPYSYGATTDRPDNAPYSISLNAALKEFQTLWQILAANDKSPPLADAYSRADLTGMANVTAEELVLLRSYIDSGALSPSLLSWWEQAYQIMANASATLQDKLKGLAELENTSGGVFDSSLVRKYFLGKGVEIVRVAIVDTPRVEILDVSRPRHSGNRKARAKRTEADFIAKPVDIGDSGQATARRGSRDAPLIQPERAAFSAAPAPANTRAATTTALTGSVSHFSDDNPIKVSAVYGTIYYDPETGEPQDFDSFAELEAFPTGEPGKYFTYAWNRMWYTVKYSPQQSSLWLPLGFTERYWKNGASYAIYAGEILYRDWQSRYPELNPADTTAVKQAICQEAGLGYRRDKCFQQALLELHADEANSIVEQHVRPYQTVDGQPQFDKDTNRLKTGDEVWFMFDSFGLEPGSTPARLANTFSNPVHFTQAPVFDVEMMAAISGVTLLPKKFYYAMRATDIAGNITISQPFLAKTPMPACAKLTEANSTFAQALTTLASASAIEFVSPLGEAMDEALSIVMVAAEAEENADFLAQVESLYSTVYNKTTLDLEASDWVWGERVDWTKARSGMETVLPGLKAIAGRECPG